MALRIDQDHARFRQIVRGHIRKELKKYISQGELLGKQGKHVVKIPLPRIAIPHFRFGERQMGGVGQGEGEVGDPLSSSEQDGKAGKAGDQPGEHELEVELTLEELADILGEELELPHISAKGKQRLVTEKIKYTGVYRRGPESLRLFKRTFKQALKRQIASGTYNAGNPIIIPTREDRRYRTFRIQRLPETNALIVYMMDVSGSMGDEQKEIVRLESFWIDTWIKRHYKGVEVRYIIHDAAAREVDRETFFHTRESGGTMISSAYELCAEIIEKQYSAAEWNIYLFHFSDGDNWSTDDTQKCIGLLQQHLLPVSNQFGYGQVESPYGSGQFIKDLKEIFGENDGQNLVTSEIKDRQAILPSIKEFLSKGR